MKVEVTYFDGCPAYEAAEKTVRQVLSEKGIEAEVELVAVNSDEEAQRLHLTGSPAIRVDNRDLFPVGKRRVAPRLPALRHHGGPQGFSDC